VRGIWRLKGGTLTVLPFTSLRPAEAAEVHEEGEALLTFAVEGPGHNVRVEAGNQG
jgi:hypothetical protein